MNSIRRRLEFEAAERAFKEREMFLAVVAAARDLQAINKWLTVSECLAGGDGVGPGNRLRDALDALDSRASIINK